MIFKKMCRVSARRLSIYNFIWELLKATKKYLKSEKKTQKFIWYPLQQFENGSTCVQSPYPNKFKRCDDLQLITRCSQTCSELVPILGTAWEFVASQMLHTVLTETFMML
jgi:hypothetical protein